MDMFKGVRPLSISSPKGNNTTRLTSTNPYGNYQSSDDEASLSRPLISERTLDEEVPVTTFPESQQIISVNRSMPSLKQCSFTQALVNGNVQLIICCQCVNACWFLSSSVKAFSLLFCLPRNQCSDRHRTPFNTLCC